MFQFYFFQGLRFLFRNQLEPDFSDSTGHDNHSLKKQLAERAEEITAAIVAQKSAANVTETCQSELASSLKNISEDQRQNLSLD